MEQEKEGRSGSAAVVRCWTDSGRDWSKEGVNLGFEIAAPATGPDVT